MTQTVQAMDGFVIAVGWQVKFFTSHGVSGEGIVREIKNDRVLIDPNWRSLVWPEYGDGAYWFIKPELREKHGHPDYFDPRDHGIGLGQITATKPWHSPYVHVEWQERNSE